MSIVVGIILNSNKKKETKVTTNSSNETIKVAENTSKETVSENTKSSEMDSSTEESKTEEVTENESEIEESSYVENITEEQRNYSENNKEQNYVQNENENSNNESDNTPSNEPEYNPPAEIPTQPAKKGEAHIAYKPDGTWDLQNTYFDNIYSLKGINISKGIMGTNEYYNFKKENNLDVYMVQDSLSGVGKTDPVYIDNYTFLIFTRDNNEVKAKYNRISNSFYIVN